MSIGTALTVLKFLLSLAVFFAQRAERADIVEALTNELEILQGKRTRAAADARDDVMSGRVQPDPDDPYRRD